MTCPFCTNQEIKDRTIIENDLAFAFPTNTPIVPGHILICPKRHIQYYEETTQEEKNAIEELREKLKKALRSVIQAQGFNYAWNENEVGGQSVPHFHLHILPRKRGDAGIHEYEPRKFLYRSSGDRGLAPQTELVEVARLVRENI